jgi:pyruvate/oxaloacetate carboxyltransferase
MDTIRFVDTTIRDGHQSLWAENIGAVSDLRNLRLLWK